MSAVAVALSGSAASAVAAVLLVAVVPVAVPREPEAPALAQPLLVQVPPGLRVLLPAQAPPEPPLLRNLSASPLPRVVVESEEPVRLQGRRSFSAATARSSPPTGKPM